MKTRIIFYLLIMSVFVFAGSALAGVEGTLNTLYGNGAGATLTAPATSLLYNTFIGTGAGNNNTDTGLNNTFIGTYAGNANISADNNTFIGRSAGRANETGSYNTFVGMQSGNDSIIGNYNTFIGYMAGYNIESGARNTFIGREAGKQNITGIDNVFLGDEAGYWETGSNKLYIDSSDTSTPLIYGEFDNDIVTINGNLEVIGPDNGLVWLSDNTTNSTTKASRMVLWHYTNAEEPVYLFGAASTSTNNFVAFGGGSTIGNAATQLDLFTAPNNTTQVGTPRLTIKGNGYVGIGTQSPAYPLHMASDARVTTGGVWTDASSREYKENIKELSANKAAETLKGLNPVEFNYKVDKEEGYVGFIAEDVPELVATRDRKGLSPMDIVALLTKVVKEQQRVAQEQQKTISELSEEVKELKRELKLKGTVAGIDFPN